MDATVRALLRPLHQAQQQLIPMIDADTDAFNGYMAALKMPRATAEQAAERDAKMQEGLKTGRCRWALAAFCALLGCLLLAAAVGVPSTCSSDAVTRPAHSCTCI